MVRQTLLQSIKPAIRVSAPVFRSVSYTAARKAEGDTGATRSGGAAQGDAFTKREQAEESHYVKQKEQEKLKALQEKIKEHRKHLESMNKHIDETLKETEKM